MFKDRLSTKNPKFKDYLYKEHFFDLKDSKRVKINHLGTIKRLSRNKEQKYRIRTGI